MPDEPETWEKHEARRREVAAERLARELVNKVHQIEPRLPDENEHRHMRIDVYPKPTF